MMLLLKQQKSLTAPRSNLWTQRRINFATLEHDYDGMVKVGYNFMMNEDEMKRMMRDFMVRKRYQISIR